MKRYYVTSMIILLVMQVSLAQTQVSLLDKDHVREYLSLSNEQFEKINLKINNIKQILEEDKKIIAEIKERVKNGDEPGFFEKIGVKRGHDKRSSKIEDLIDDIEDQLTDQQKTKFDDIEKPELNALNKEDVFGK
ncbi:MAG TPA: hypothetical protein VK870_03885 [Ignavibacteriaceae bacterium]|nr:hypothetical protein [Ignavibacteriaceae bacterium]